MHQLRTELIEVLAQLVGKSAWNSKVGSGTGSIFTLQFGAALLVESKWGEFSLMVHCAWRVTHGSNILFSWHDDSNQILAPGLATLEASAVRDVTLSEWNDLTISFTNGRVLQIINDFSPYYEFDSSWFIGYQNKGFYSIKPDNSVEFAKE